jgi:opacity protein-like surface antigen
MRRTWAVVGAMLIVAGVAAVPAPAAAEWFADLFAGVAVTATRDVEFGTDTFFSVKYKDSFSIGGRAGYWFEDLPFIGLAVGSFWFRPDLGRQSVTSQLGGSVQLGSTDIGMAAFGIEVLLRMPLFQDRDFPAGRLQPYLGVGPTLYVLKVDDTTNFGPPANQTRTKPSIGFQAMAGVAWQFHKHIAIFGEYRFTQSHTEVDFGTATKTTATFDIFSNHILGGVSVRF